MSDFNPYAAPVTDITKRFSDDAGEGVWFDGGDLLCSKLADFPDRCLKCNAPCNGYRLHKTLRWHAQVYYFLVLISPLLYLIVVWFASHKAKLALPLCEKHRKRRIRAIIIAWLFPLGGIVLLPLGIGLAASAGENQTAIESGTILLGSLMILGGLIYGLLGSRAASTKRIDARFVRLSKVSPEFLHMLPLFQGSDREVKAFLEGLNR